MGFVVAKENEITPNEIIIENEDNLIYTGNVINPKIEVTYRGRSLIENIDYNVIYDSNSLNAGNYELTVNGIGSYIGKVKLSYTIKKMETKFNFECSDVMEGGLFNPVVTENNTPYTPKFKYKKLGADEFTEEMPNEIGTYTILGYIEGENCIYREIEKTAEIKVFVMPFKDVLQSSWYYDAVKYVYNNRLVSGYDEETYAPEDKLTRGMIVTILYRMEGSPSNDGISKFSDVGSREYYARAVKWAVDAGIVHGYGDSDKFGPEDKILRQDLAVVLKNYADYKKKNTNSATDLSKYSDSKNIYDYANSAMQWAVGSGVITGNADGTLAPRGNASRAEAAAMIQKYCQKVGR